MAKNKKTETEEPIVDGLTLACKALEKDYPGAVFQGDARVLGVEFFSSQSVGIDKALGGGWAKGRIIELFGMESSGKTTLALHAVAEIQKLGGKALYIDMEHALCPDYATNLGVDWDNLLISQPECGEDALNIVETIIKSGVVSLVIVDSVAALIPRQELEKKIGDSSMGKHAMLMSQAMRKLTGLCHRTNCTIIFINQIRQKVGFFMGSPDVTTGGLGLKFYASQRVDIRRISGNKEGEIFISNRTRAKVVKNKVATPFKEHEFNIVYGVGIDKTADILETGEKYSIITKIGHTYSFKDQVLGVGKEKAVNTLRGNPELAKEIYNQICPSILPLKDIKTQS